MRKIIAILLILTLVLGAFSGCSNDPKPKGSEPADNSILEGTVNNGGENSNADPVEVDFSKTDADMFTERDNKSEYDASKAVTIQLSATTATAAPTASRSTGLQLSSRKKLPMLFPAA